MNMLEYQLVLRAIEQNNKDIKSTKQWLDSLIKNPMISEKFKNSVRTRLLAYTQTGVILQNHHYHLRSQVLSDHYGKLSVYANQLNISAPALIHYIYGKRKRDAALANEINDHIDMLLRRLEGS